VSAASLLAAVTGPGYTCWRSEIAQPRRCIAVLSRRPTAVTDVEPGFVQHVEDWVSSFYTFTVPPPPRTDAVSRAANEHVFQARMPFILNLSIVPTGWRFELRY
jgi:hypothetical protein